MPTSIQFLYSSGCSSVAAATIPLPSLVSPARIPAVAKVPAQTSTSNLRGVFIIRLISVSKQRSHIGPVRFLVAASRPAGSLLQETRVVDVPNEDMPRCSLLLEMALQAK